MRGAPCIKDIEGHREYLSYMVAFRNFQVELSVLGVGATPFPRESSPSSRGECFRSMFCGALINAGT